jgi:hypothetical protein
VVPELVRTPPNAEVLFEVTQRVSSPRRNVKNRKDENYESNEILYEVTHKIVSPKKSVKILDVGV